MRKKYGLFWLTSLWILGVCFVVGCAAPDATSVHSTSVVTQQPTSPALREFRLVSGSENKEFELLVTRFAATKGVKLLMTYQGSVDIMRGLEAGTLPADAVWPASSLWLDLGDSQKKVVKRQSIYRTPVVMGVKKSVAQNLGWIGKPVSVNQILAASESGKLRFMMTSATQSNSGACAYLGYLYAFAGAPDVLTKTQLENSTVQAKIKRILGAVNRTSGSSGWLKDIFAEKYENYDAMVNYESLVIALNQQLTAQGKEPLYVIYPQDGLAVADSPLGFIDAGDAATAAFFEELQTFLLSDGAQKQITAQGCRTGSVGLTMSDADPEVFNAAWGIDVKKNLTPIRFPEPVAVREALELYQTAFRKPSFTVYCVDFSGSMEGKGVEQLKSAMRLLLKPAEAKKYLLQTTPRDVSVIIPFNQKIIDEWKVRGNQSGQLEDLAAKVTAMVPNGGTNIYAPTARAIAIMDAEPDLEDYFPSIVLMTDGESNLGRLEEVRQALEMSRQKVELPVNAVLFGSASEGQLRKLTQMTAGKIFDGRKDLVKTFREVKGYN